MHEHFTKKYPNEHLEKSPLLAGEQYETMA